jgi:NIMA (never in mitosis gene a)-related kinase
MEYADGGDLGAIIRTHKESKKQIEEEAIWNWLLQVCSAIKYLHSKKILHRDIKAQNIFLTKTNQVLLIK